MCALDLQCWDRTEAAVSGLNYFEQKFRAIITVEGKHYPCWIGPKANHRGTGVMIIGQGDPPCQQNQNTMVQSVPCENGYTLYQFVNDGPGNNEGYGEMRRYLWNYHDEAVSIVILGIAPLTDIRPANIAGQLADLGTFAVQ